MLAGAILCTGRFLLALDGCKRRGRAKVCECCTGGAAKGAMGWSWDGRGGACVEIEPYLEPWLKVVAALLGVTVEEAVCVITVGTPVSLSAKVLSMGEGSMDAAEVMS